MAYENNNKAPNQFQLCLVNRVLVIFNESLPGRIAKMIIKANAPEINRILVKLAGSILEGCRANRQKIELAAKANKAKPVITKILIESGKSLFLC